MINFTGGIVKCGDVYLPTRNISQIKEYNDNQSLVTISGLSRNSYSEQMAREDALEGSADKWAKAYCDAERANTIIDVLA